MILIDLAKALQLATPPPHRTGFHAAIARAAAGSRQYGARHRACSGLRRCTSVGCVDATQIGGVDQTTPIKKSPFRHKSVTLALRMHFDSEGMIMWKLALAISVAVTPFSAGLAQEVDTVAYNALARGRLAVAEARLAALVAKGTREPGVLLNLASTYARTGRAGDAAMLYRRVTEARNVQMELADGSPAWSHDLATIGLTRLAAMSSLAR